MGTTYGSAASGRKVFDPARLEQGAAEIRQQNTGPRLHQQLANALLPATSFGQIPGGPEAHARLEAKYRSVVSELSKVGIDLTDLASRTLTAGELAREVDRATQAAARRGRTGR